GPAHDELAPLDGPNWYNRGELCDRPAAASRPATSASRRHADADADSGADPDHRPPCEAQAAQAEATQPVTASAQALHDLLAPQQLDPALDQVRHQRTNLPERSARDAAAARRRSIQVALDEIGSRRGALAEAEAKLERSLRELDARSADLAGRLQRTMVVR